MVVVIDCPLGRGFRLIESTTTRELQMLASRIVKGHLSTAVRPNPQFLRWNRLSETTHFEDFRRRVLQTAERSYPMIAVQNAQSVGKSHGNRRSFEYAILQDMIRSLLETCSSLVINGPGGFLYHHAPHNGLRSMAEVCKAAVHFSALPGNFPME
jgi:hypothetical protein